jgi:hypothetical protein
MGAMRFLAVLVFALLASCAGKAPGPAASGAAASSGSAASATATAGVGGEQPLLSGRLLVRLPEGAKVSARPHSIMAAPGSAEEESRVLLVPGQPFARFVMIVSEVFELGSGDAVADATEFVRADPDERYRVEAIAVGPGLRAAAYVPAGRADGDHPSLVLGGLVQTTDASLVSVQFYILPEMRGESDKWRGEAKKILGSFAAGPRKLDAAGGETRLALGAEELVLTRPKGYCLTAQPGPDFDVYHLRKLVKAGSPPTTIGVYVGGHPAFQYRQREPPVANVGAIPGTFLGQSTSFSEWQPFPNAQRREAIVKVSDGTFVHVFVTAAAADMPELMGVVSAMKVTTRSQPAQHGAPK